MGGPITAPWDVCVNTDFSSPSGLADADAFNTCYETWGGAVVTTLDSLIGRLPNSPPVSPAFGGVITKFNIAVSGMLEIVEVIAAAIDDDPNTRVDQQIAGGVASVAVPVATAWAGAKLGAATGAALGSFVPVAGTAVGGALGFVGGLIAGVYGSALAETYVEGLFDEPEVNPMISDSLSLRPLSLISSKDVVDANEKNLKTEMELGLEIGALGRYTPNGRLVDESIYRPAGPRGMGFDINDPRGPWQDPLAPSGWSISKGVIGVGSSIVNAKESWADKYGGGGNDSGLSGSGGSGPSKNPKVSVTTTKNDYGYDKTTISTKYPSGVETQTINEKVLTPAGPKDTVKVVTKPVPKAKDDPKKVGPQPILLDLDGDGIEISELPESTRFVADDTGLERRMAWVNGGDGVLFIDADGNGVISNQHEYAFTEWAGGAADDLDGLRRAFDGKMPTEPRGHRHFGLRVR